MFPGQGSRSRPKMYLPKESEKGKAISKDDNVIETQSSFYNEIDTEKDVSELLILTLYMTQKPNCLGQSVEFLQISPPMYIEDLL